MRREHLLVISLALWVLGIPGPAPARDRDRSKGRSEKQSEEVEPILQRFDVSHEIQNRPRPAERKLLPRREPGYDELQRALWRGGPNHVAAHLANGANPNARSADGDPILHYAVWLGHSEKLEDLLRAGADPNLAAKDGSTPLEKAIWGGHSSVVKQLLDFGANPKDGRAIEKAKFHGNQEIIALLDAKPGARKAITLIKPPTILRRPAAVFGSPRFTAAGGGQAIVYSPDGKLLITGDEGGAIRIFDAKTGEIQDAIQGHDHGVLGLTFIPKSRILVSAGADRLVRFWDVDTLQELKRLNDHWGQGKALAVSPDGRWLCTGRFVWQIESTNPLRLADRGHGLKDWKDNVDPLWCCFTPDSRYLILSDWKCLSVWDCSKHVLRRVEGVKPAELRILRWSDIADTVDIGDALSTGILALAIDQYTIVSAPPGQLDNFERVVKLFDNYSRAVACSPKGQFAAALGYDSRINLYDLELDKRYQHDGHGAAVLAVAASPNGTLIASGGNDCTVRVWNRKTRESLLTIPTPSFVYSVCFSPKSDVLAIGDNGGTLLLWKRAEDSITSFQPGGRITDLEFAAGGKTLISLGNNLNLIDLAAGKAISSIWADSSASGNIAASRDGALIVGTANSVGADETYKVPNAWSVDGSAIIANKDLFSESMGHRTFIDSVAFSPNGKVLAAGSAGAIRLWDMEKRSPVGEKLCGHLGSLADLKFSPDGRWLASGSWDGTARLWQIPSGRQVAVMDADVYRVSSVDFTPDGQLVTANWDGTVHLWDLSAFMR